MILKPFYDAQPGDGAGGSDAPRSFPSSWAPVDPARNGDFNGNDSPTVVATPVADGQVTPAATATPTVADATPPPTSQATPPAATITTPVTQPAAEPVVDKTPAPVVPWNEAIKAVPVEDVLKQLGNRKDVLKALGVKDIVIDLNDHYEAKGNLDEFVTNRLVDYTKYSDESMIRMQVSEKYPMLDEEQRELLFEEEMQKYEVDEATAEANPKKKALLDLKKRIDAQAFRDQKIAGQKAYVVPTIDPAAQAPQEEVIKKYISEYETKKQADQTQMLEKLTQDIMQDPLTTQLFSSKKFQIADGINLGVTNPQEIIDCSIGKKDMFDYLKDDKGVMDMNKVIDMLVFIQNPTAYKSELRKTAATDAAKSDIENFGDADSKNQIATGTGNNQELKPFERLQQMVPVSR